MRAKLSFLFVVSALSAAALLGVACSGGSSGSASTPPATEGQGTVSGPNTVGGIVPNFLMTFQGNQYRLSQVLQADQVDASAFTVIGQASQSDAGGDLTVYTRQGDDSSVYTFVKGTGGADGPQDAWFRWERQQ